MKKISNKTKAILAVNIFGHGAQLSKLKNIADKHKILLLEDNSQAPAGKVENNKFTGTVGSAEYLVLIDTRRFNVVKVEC